MKPIKVFLFGKRLRDMYAYPTRWQWFKWKMYRFYVITRNLAFTALFAFGFYSIGVINTPQVEAEKEVEAMAPVLDRIKKCESGGKHYDKNGQVLMRANTNKTVDVGAFQINSVWFAKATELGFDLTDERDNESFAEWLYKNRGTEDWYSSKHCWQK